MVNNYFICIYKFHLTFYFKIYSIFAWGNAALEMQPGPGHHVTGSREGLGGMNLWGKIPDSSINSILIDKRDVYRLQVAIYTCRRFLFAA